MFENEGENAMVRPQFIQQTLEEHYKCYVMLAYDYDGNFVVVKKINSPQEMDAMSTAFEREGVEFEENLFGKNMEDADED